LVVPAGVVTGPAWDGFAKLALPILQYRLAPSEKRLARVCGALFTTPNQMWQSYFADALRSYRMDPRIPPLLRPEQLAAYTGKTLVFAAEDDISFPGRALLERARTLLPQAELELLDACKHCPPFDDVFRGRLAARIDAFLSDAA
jgi:2-hydroxy-6-oxonona-2,4-dienedioate hydrolase